MADASSLVLFIEPGLGGDLRYSYVPFSALSHGDQARARAAYPHKAGGKYAFRDEHYYYPVKVDGSLARAARSLSIPLAWIKDDAKMRSLGYNAPNPARHESGGNPHTGASGKKYERVEILRSRSMWLKPGQFGIVVGENLSPNGERYEVYTGDGPVVGRAYLVGKSERSGATWFPPDALRFTSRTARSARANPSIAKHERGGNPRTKRPDLFVGVYPAGIVYADKSREVHGDYAKCAFLDYATLTLKFQKDCPPSLRAEIARHAATIQAKRGEQFATDASGHTVKLGPSATRHESGGNPRTRSKARGKKHPLDAAAVARIERAAAKSVPSRKRAPFTPAQRSQRGLAPLDAGLKARLDKLIGKK